MIERIEKLEEAQKQVKPESIRVNDRLVTVIGMHGASFQSKCDGDVSLKQAILAIAAHLGLKFEVEPAKGEQVKLVKVKK